MKKTKKNTLIWTLKILIQPSIITSLIAISFYLGICNLCKQHKHPILQNRTELPLTNTHTFTSYAHKHSQLPISLSQRKVIP